MSASIVVRLARPGDITQIIEMIEELALFERVYGEPLLSIKDVSKSCGFDAPNSTAMPDMVVLIAEDHAQLESVRPVGYTILMPGYSARSGKILLMKNMYVRDSHRSAGVGRALFRALANYARDNGCRHEENHVLMWNKPAVNYYKRMGALDLTVSEGWQYYRLVVNEELNN